MTTWIQNDTILDAINESDEDQLENDASSQESMDYRRYQKAAIIASSGICGEAGAFSDDSDSSNNSDSDVKIASNPAPKRQSRPEGKKLAQKKPSSRKKTKFGDSSNEESDSDQTCGA